METLTLTTPALLFSAISLIMLAYTNRFLAYAAVIRNLHDVYLGSLLLCVLTMFLIYIEYKIIAVWLFGIALLLLLISLALLIREIQISSEALEHHLADIEEHLKKK